jgi:hypothetical protein
MPNAFIATVDDNNVPHAAQRELIWEGETLLLLEELESSRTNSEQVLRQTHGADGYSAFGAAESLQIKSQVLSGKKV